MKLGAAQRLLASITTYESPDREFEDNELLYGDQETQTGEGVNNTVLPSTPVQGHKEKRN
jgi:hypothetical protein